MPEVLFITGSSGIAAATARMWPAGEPVFVAGLDETQCRALCGELTQADCCVADVSDENAVRNAVEACLNRFGRIDAVFNVAGISARTFGDGPLHECTAQGWDRAMDVNAKGAFFVCREVVRNWMERRQPGAILNMGSVLARRPAAEYFSTVGYAASKGAIESMSLAASAYYAKHGIRVNVIAPGLVRTPMSTRAQSDPGIMNFVERRQALSRGILPAEDVARTAVFLLRRESGPITGQIITVDGGWSVS